MTADVDLNGKLCPFIIMLVLREVGVMRAGESRRFLVDDPLAIKSVPEELEENPEVSVRIDKARRGWEITVSK
jgi:TusA-related sulfurtransferase